ncbi:MAG: hypothetical protein ACAH21_09355 [Ramlibacter sp.]|nr:hypothetical protein [Ramlibacter sp.]
MTTLSANSGFARIEQILADLAAAFTQSAGSAYVALAVVPTHLSLRAKRLMRADY